MRVAALALALAASLLRPATEDWRVALPHGGAAWLAPLQRFVEARYPPAAPAHEVATDDRRNESLACDCSCEPQVLPLGEAASVFLCGVAFWPVLDLLQLAKRAWQRRVQALERILQGPLLLRAPDRP